MPHSATLNEFIYLNREMAALARAGLPLDRGLAMLGGDSTGNAGRLATAIAKRVEAGKSLDEAIAEQDMPLPTLYRSVVKAGIRSGNLADALQSIAESAARVARLRNATGLAMLYPLCLFLLAYGMGCLLILLVIPDMLETIRMMGSEPPWLAAQMVVGANHLGVWLWLPPLLVTFLFAIWWFQSGRARGMIGSRKRRSRSVIGRSRLAIFSELMALMTSHGIPLGEAVTTAAGATGDRSLIAGAQAWETGWREGRSLADPLREAGYPPLIVWLLTGNHDQAALSTLFRQASGTYEKQAARAAYWRAFTLPMLLTGVVGGTIVIAYGLMFFLPWVSMLNELAIPVDVTI